MHSSILGRLIAALVQRYHRRTAIRRLSELDDHLLRDIGIERCDIRRVVDGLAAQADPPANDKTFTPQVLLLQPIVDRRAAR